MTGSMSVDATADAIPTPAAPYRFIRADAATTAIMGRTSGLISSVLRVENLGPLPNKKRALVGKAKRFQGLGRVGERTQPDWEAHGKR